MASSKLYAGVALRDLRNQFGVSQREFAVRLGISLPYLSQMENNHRPISTGVVLALAREFDFDVTDRETVTQRCRAAVSSHHRSHEFIRHKQ